MPSTDFKVHDGLLAVQQTSEGPRLRISLEGEVDLANAETAASTLREALEAGKDVVVDLAQLSFLDSTGIAMLVRAIEEGGERLRFLPSEHEPVGRLLSLTGLAERMTFGAAPAVVASVDGGDARVDGGEVRVDSVDAEPLLPAA